MWSQSETANTLPTVTSVVACLITSQYEPDEMSVTKQPEQL